MPVPPFIQWLMAVILDGFIVSAAMRYCLSSCHHPHLQGGIVVGSMLSISLFPLYRQAHTEPDHWPLGGIFVGDVGMTLVTLSRSLADRVRTLPRRLMRWRGQPASEPPFPGEEPREHIQEQELPCNPEGEKDNADGQPYKRLRK